MVLPGAAQLIPRLDDRWQVRRDVDPLLRQHVIEGQDQSCTDLLRTRVQGQIRLLARGDGGVELDPVVLLGIGGDVEVDVRVGGLEIRLQGREEAFFFERPEIDRDPVAGAARAATAVSTTAPIRVGSGRTAGTAHRDERQHREQAHCSSDPPHAPILLPVRTLSDA